MTQHTASPSGEHSPGRLRRGVPFSVLLILVGLLGCIVGLGGFTFAYARGTSYITDDPAACANCHVMRDVYTAWSRGSHRAAAVCNDCHTPHTSILEKYAVKAINGVNHSVAFTTGNYPTNIRITKMNRDVANGSCLYCHATVTTLIAHQGDEALDCIRCHAEVGHDE
jgi:cytochrome c nitrite reductase small subunit